MPSREFFLREQGIIDREQGIRPRTNFLNHTASQNDVMNRLPETRDYDMDCFARGSATLSARPLQPVENEAVAVFPVSRTLTRSLAYPAPHQRIGERHSLPGHQAQGQRRHQK